MRSFVRINPQVCDVLILDTSGSEYVKQCMPSKTIFEVLPARNIIPYVLSFNFIFRVLIRLSQRHSIGTSVLFSIVDVIKPKIIITFIDNNYLIGKIQQAYGEKLCIAIQNGIRGDSGGWNHKTNISVLYGFGDYEKEYIMKRNINILEYRPIGSLKYGIYHEKFKDQQNKCTHDVVLVSQYTGSNSLIGKLAREHMRELFLCTKNACIRNKLKFSVALRDEVRDDGGSEEVDFFRSMDCAENIELISNNFDSFGSYRAVNSAKVLISFSSTLAFEFFGSGSRTLFSGLVDNNKLVHEMGIVGCFEQMPRENLLHSFENIDEKLIRLLNMTNKEYMNVTNNARAYYMKFNEQNQYPHQLIMDRIKNYLHK